MRTLFLTAKKVAIDNNEKHITLQHIKKALETLEFIDNDAKKIIYKYLDITPQINPFITQEDIDEASRHERLDFNSEVKEFKDFLQDHGYTLNKRISKVFIEKQNTLKQLKENITHLEESLKSQLFGQDSAIEAVCDKIVESSYYLAHTTPKAIFFFLGPPATGKTMLAQLISKELDGYDACKIFDMTQYSNANEGFSLFGLPKGYSSAKEGKLTSFVKKHPASVLVFDEIEKAHPGVLTNFLMMLSSGYAEDSFSEEIIDFTQTIIVFTSNLGSELYNNQNFINMMQENPFAAQSTIIEAISREERILNGYRVKVLSPEFLSRLSQGQIVLFNKLPFNALQSIATNTIIEVQENFEKAFGLEVAYDSFADITTLLLLSFTPRIDIRKLKSKLPLVLFDTVTDFIRKNDLPLQKIFFDIESDSKATLQEALLQLNDKEKTKLLHELFRKNETFSYEIATSYNDTTLNITFKNLQRKKLARSVDFSGDGGLVFEVPSISFDDVAGHKVAKKRLREVINLLKSPKELARFDLDIPKGMLLYGVPGTGKTMLANAFAHEANLPFIETTGSEILNIELMKEIFTKAREYAPSIIFIDEIDAIGSRNGTNLDIIINQFLTELNGFSQEESDEQVFVIAATNLKEKIDPAILRSGRIDLHVEIDSLDREAREFFIDKILQKPTEGDFDKEKILTYTAGMTGADLEKVSRESSLYIFRHNLKAITQEVLIEQINTIKYGSRITHKSLEKVLESTAIHEAGHAVISRILMPDVKIEQITVTPRANTLGFVSYEQEKNYTNLTREDIKNKLCIAFAGRESQLKAYGEEGFDSGASNDLDMATQYAYYAIATLGMGEETGYINISKFKEKRPFEAEIEKELKLWLDEARLKTKELINKHWPHITKLAKLLQDKEVVHENELLQLLKE